MALTNEEFKAKYGFEKPQTLKDRDMLIFSNLSDLKILMSHDLNEAMKRTDQIKLFMWDTGDLTK